MDDKQELFPFAISTSKGHYVILQCRDNVHATERYNAEESHRGIIKKMFLIT